MTPNQARYWYGYLQRLADKLDDLNASDGNANLMYTAGNEAVRMAAQTMLAFTEDVTATAEMPAVDLGEAS